MSSFRKHLDESPRLSQNIQRLSGGLSRQRGLPILAAIGLTILSLIVHIVLAFIPNSVILSILAFVLLHVAILVGFIGIVLAEPLGRG